MKMQIRIALLITIFTVFVTGCATSAGPDSSIPGQTEWLAIDFEKFRVESKSYPKFQAKQPISPPTTVLAIPLTDIKESDLWEVRYRLNDFYLIFSESYNERQCRLLMDNGKARIAHKSPFNGECRSQYLYCIVVDLKGHVTNGWQLVFNPEVAVSVSARAQSFKPLSRQAGDWGVQPLFKAVN